MTIIIIIIIMIIIIDIINIIDNNWGGWEEAFYGEDM